MLFNFCCSLPFFTFVSLLYQPRGFTLVQLVADSDAGAAYSTNTRACLIASGPGALSRRLYSRR